MDMSDPAFTFGEIVKAIMTGLGAAAIWLLKKLGDKHIETIENLSDRIDRIIDRMDKLSERVTVIEVKESIDHPKDK